MTNYALTETDRAVLFAVEDMAIQSKRRFYTVEPPPELANMNREQLFRSLNVMVSIGAMKFRQNHGDGSKEFEIFPEVINIARQVRDQLEHPDFVAGVQKWAREHRMYASLIIAVAVLGGTAAAANSVWDLVDRIIRACQSAPPAP